MRDNTAVEVLGQAIGYSMFCNLPARERRTPGAIIKLMSKRQREILKDLKSDDIKRVRIDYV